MSPEAYSQRQASPRDRYLTTEAREALVEQLHEYVHVETPTDSLPGLLVLTSRLTRNYENLGGIVRAFPFDTGVNLVADFPGAGDKSSLAPILLIGHSDTVWDVGTLETTVPWVQERDIIRGPGVYDMKSGLVIIESALAITRKHSSSYRPVRVVITADEEKGSPSALELLAEIGPDCVAVLGFESPHPDGSLKIGRLGSTRVRISVTGIEAHAALDAEDGVSAIDELVDQLFLLRAFTTELINQFPGHLLYNVGTVSGGGRTNVVAKTASADLGLRFGSTRVEKRFFEFLATLTPRREGSMIKTETLSHRPAWQGHDRDHDLLRLLSETAGLELYGSPAKGSADTNLFGALGIPTIDGWGARGAGAHATTEHIFTESLFERAELMARLLAGV